jgi:hypothetical protein
MSKPKETVYLNANGTVNRRALEFVSYNSLRFGSEQITPLQVDYDIPNVDYTQTLGAVVTENTVVEIQEDGTEVSQTTSTVTYPTKSYSINPFTEQILEGFASGKFQLNEQVLQNTNTASVYNYLILNGVSADGYTPVVGSPGVCGPIGVQAAQFKGSYLDTDTVAAGILVPNFTNTGVPYFMMEGWVYLDALPSGAYDPILITRSFNGVSNDSRNSFRLEYDNSDGRLKFEFNPSSETGTGYANSVYVTPAGASAGFTTGVWHKFGIAYASSGGSASCHTYWNGTRVQSATGLCGSIRNSTSSLAIGSGALGSKPFKGWLDDVHVCIGYTASEVLRDFSGMGSTAPFIAEKEVADTTTVYLMSMDGPVGTSFFPIDNLCRVLGTVTFIGDSSGSSGAIGVGMISRQDEDPVSDTLFSGICGGFSGSSVAANIGPVFGANSGAYMRVDTVIQTRGLSSAKVVRGNASDFTTQFITGYTTMYGAIGNSGDFPRLFSGWTGGNTFSFLPIQENINTLRNVYDTIVVSGFTGRSVISDYYGTQFYFGTADVSRLYSDVLSYRETISSYASTSKNQITASGSFSAMLGLKGMSAEAFSRKVGPFIDSVGVADINPIAKISKFTNSPKTKNTGFFAVYDFPEEIG